MLKEFITFFGMNPQQSKVVSPLFWNDEYLVQLILEMWLNINNSGSNNSTVMLVYWASCWFCILGPCSIILTRTTRASGTTACSQSLCALCRIWFPPPPQFEQHELNKLSQIGERVIWIASPMFDLNINSNIAYLGLSSHIRNHVKWSFFQSRCIDSSANVHGIELGSSVD